MEHYCSPFCLYFKARRIVRLPSGVYPLRLCVCVCVIKGVTEVTDSATKTPGPRSAGVQAAFVRAHVWRALCCITMDQSEGQRRERGPNKFVLISRTQSHPFLSFRQIVFFRAQGHANVCLPQLCCPAGEGGGLRNTPTTSTTTSIDSSCIPPPCLCTAEVTQVYNVCVSSGALHRLASCASKPLLSLYTASGLNKHRLLLSNQNYACLYHRVLWGFVRSCGT